MKGSFKIVSVAEIASHEKGGIAIGPFGSKMKSDSYVEEGVPVIRGLNIGDSKGLEGEFVYISEEDAKRMGNANVYNGDLVFPHRGAIGRVGLIADSEDGHAVLSSSLMKLTVDQKKAIPEFVFYYFRSKLGIYEILKYSSTVGTPGIGQPLTSLKSMKLPLPEMSEQRRIAHILGTLDDKIALNRQQNATLEAMAQALFRSWFVDFDPVLDKALAAGHNIPEPLQAKAQRRLALGDKRKPLPPEVAGLFPDRFVYEEEVGWVPEGWVVKPLKQFYEIYDNKRIPLSKKDRSERKGQFPYYGATSIMDYVDDYIFDGVYVLMGEDGSVIDDNGHPILQYVWGKFWVNNHAHVLKGKNGISDENLLLFLKNTKVGAYVTGAVQPKINQRNLGRIVFLFGGNEIHQAFGEVIDPFFSKMRDVTVANQILLSLRDTLLPKLISGELRVPAAESLVEKGI